MEKVDKARLYALVGEMLDNTQEKIKIDQKFIGWLEELYEAGKNEK